MRSAEAAASKPSSVASAFSTSVSSTGPHSSLIRSARAAGSRFTTGPVRARGQISTTVRPPAGEKGQMWKPASARRRRKGIPRTEPVPTDPAPPIWNGDFGRMPATGATSASVRGAVPPRSLAAASPVVPKTGAHTPRASSLLLRRRAARATRRERARCRRGTSAGGRSRSRGRRRGGRRPGR